MPRIQREKKTLRAMLRIYCRHHHGARRALCDECGALEQYALKRLESCRYGEKKSTCAKCPTHCYKPDMREEIRKVMRFSGPRMLSRHPLLAVMHLLDGRRA